MPNKRMVLRVKAPIDLAVCNAVMRQSHDPR